MGGLEEVYMDECVVVEGFKGVESGRGPGVAVGGGAGGRQRGGGGSAGGPRGYTPELRGGWYNAVIQFQR